VTRAIRTLSLAVCLLACLLASPFAGCARVDAVTSGPVDPTGTYEVQMAYGANGCGFDWQEEGALISGVEFSVRPGEVSGLQGEISGLVGLFIGIALGSNRLLGEVERGRLSMRLDGIFRTELAGCAFVNGIDLDAVIVGDAIEGTAIFRRRLPETDLCDPVRCESVLTFVGRRRPPVDGGMSDASLTDGGDPLDAESVDAGSPDGAPDDAGGAPLRRDR
jgi:hypothetical protein